MEQIKIDVVEKPMYRVWYNGHYAWKHTRYACLQWLTKKIIVHALQDFDYQFNEYDSDGGSVFYEFYYHAKREIMSGLQRGVPLDIVEQYAVDYADEYFPRLPKIEESEAPAYEIDF